MAHIHNLMWCDVATNLIMVSHNSYLHVTHKYIESQVQSKLQVALKLNVTQIENKFNKIIKIVLLVTFDGLDGL